MSSISTKERNMNLVMSALRQWYGSGKVYGPSYRNLVDLSGLPIGTVHKTCHFLRQEGLIQFEDNVARSMVIKNMEEK